MRRPTDVFRRVILPLIAPGVISGALFAFITSFDEVVVAMFLTGPQQRTLPRQMFDGLRDNISPTILAVATLLILVAVMLLATVELPPAPQPAHAWDQRLERASDALAVRRGSAPTPSPAYGEGGRTRRWRGLRSRPLVNRG